jgi:hypothetical protein
MASIADAAGVSLKTVYLGFETKSGVLRALWHLLLRDDDSPIPVGDRSWFTAVLDEPDPERKLPPEHPQCDDRPRADRRPTRPDLDPVRGSFPPQRTIRLARPG